MKPINSVADVHHSNAVSSALTSSIKSAFNGLVAHNYYSSTTMMFEPASQLLAFVLPMSFQKGDLTFSQLTNTPEAIRIPVKREDKPRHVISTAQLPKGVWRVCLNWSDGRQQYHDEQQISV